MKCSIKILLLILLIQLRTENSNAQGMSGADRKFENLEYSEAIPIYLKVVEKDNFNTKAWSRLGDCYRLTNQQDKAENCYSMALRDPKAPSINKLYYAKALLTNGN